MGIVTVGGGESPLGVLVYSRSNQSEKIGELATSRRGTVDVV